MSKATPLAELQELHQLVAKSLNKRITLDMEDNIPTDAATLGAAIKFLKDNSVTADPADGSTNVATVADVAASGYGVIITTGAGVYSVQNKATMPNTYQPHIYIYIYRLRSYESEGAMLERQMTASRIH